MKRREPVVDKEHINRANTADQRVKSYDKRALEIRKVKHLDRVAKTKFMSKYLRKKSTSPIKGNFFLNLEQTSSVAPKA